MPLRIHENILVFYKYLPTYNPQFWQSTPYKKKVKPIDANCYGYVEWDGRELCQSEDGRRFPVDILQFDNPVGCAAEGGKRMHPTQKPVKLLEYLIKTYTNENEIVLDICIGSGSTAVAAINTNRHFIGFETDKNFFDTAIKRVEDARRLKDNARRLEAKSA